jgi:hypothetical protein
VFLSRSAWLACAAFAVCLVLLGTAACIRPLWFDEILGRLVAQMDWPAGALAAARAGVDLTPPGWAALSRLALDVGGGADSAPRFVSWLSFLVALAIVAKVAHEHWGGTGAVCASAALFLSEAAYYATEGRAYGAALACAAGALWAWDRSAKSPARAGWLALLGLTLAASLLLHYFAVLVWVPIALGELVRWRTRRRPDLGVLAASLAALLPLAWLAPVAREGATHVRYAPFSAPSIGTLDEHYAELLDRLAVVLPALALVALGLALARHGRALPGRLARAIGTDPRAAALCGLLLLPACSMLLAELGGSGLCAPRYALPFTLGAALGLAGLLHALHLSAPWSRRVAASLVLLCLFVSFRHVRGAARQAERAADLPLAQAPLRLPLVCAEQLEPLELWHRATPEQRQRLRIVAEPELGVAWGVRGTAQVNLLGLRQLAPLPIVSWRELVQGEPVFVLVQRQRNRTPLFSQLLADSARLVPLPSSRGWEAWLVETDG